MFTKPVVFVVISILVVALIYDSFAPFIVFAEPYGEIDCRQTGTLVVTCCQDHLEKTSGGIGFDIVTYCTECQMGPGGPQGGDNPVGTYNLHSCSERYIDVSAVEPTPTPTPPVFDTTAPLQGGVLEQLEQKDQPPLFGRNEAAVPPTGSIEQPFTTTTPPLFGNIPQGGGFGILQEPETPPMFGQVAPQVVPPIGEVQVQEPDEQVTEEDGQVIAKDEDEDDDDGPVPPECPTTGPIPPDCTLKPKFPDERAIE